MDSNSKSDPSVFFMYPSADSNLYCIVISLLCKQEQSPYIKGTLDPIYPLKDGMFPIYLSLAETIGALKLIVWDKVIIGSDHLGEIALPVQHWFQGQPLLFDDLDEVGPDSISTAGTSWCFHLCHSF